MAETATQEEPLAQLGFGIVAYLDIMYTLMWGFIIFSLLLIPTIHTFKQGGGYGDRARIGYANTMISNLGYSRTECRNIPVSLANLQLSCPYGTIGSVLEYGVNNEDSGSPPDSCMNNDINKACKPTSKNIGNLLKQAVGKDSYNVQFSKSDIFAFDPSKVCGDPTNLLFVQYTCVQSKAEQAQKYDTLVLATSTAAFISLFFVLLL